MCIQTWSGLKLMVHMPVLWVINECGIMILSRGRRGHSEKGQKVYITGRKRDVSKPDDFSCSN
jgi:hypothetical protein